MGAVTVAATVAQASNDVSRSPSVPDANVMHVDLDMSVKGNQPGEVLATNTCEIAAQRIELPTMRLADGSVCQDFVQEVKTDNGVTTIRIGTSCDKPEKP